jgi:D-glycero-D-manno-heptose 1,7-bisphosphate phosphatase
MKRAVFFDRDGTLIEEKEYLHRPDQVRFCPGAIPALRQLSEGGYSLIMVTNQSGVGRGYFTMEDVEKVHRHITLELEREKVWLEKIYVAPEAPDCESRGRKPSAFFLFEAQREFGLDLGKSYFIGDKLIDLECGWNAGVKASILVRTGYGAKVEKSEQDKLKNAVVVDDLGAGADWILAKGP